MNAPAAQVRRIAAAGRGILALDLWLVASKYLHPQVPLTAPGKVRLIVHFAPTLDANFAGGSRPVLQSKDPLSTAGANKARVK